MPVKTPVSIKALYLKKETEMPAVSTELGFSPTARNRKPNLVLKTINWARKGTSRAKYTKIVCPEINSL